MNEALSGPSQLARGRQTAAPVWAAALVAAALAWVPWLGPLRFPLRLLSTLVHELGHGLAAVATGGSFVQFVVRLDGSGQALTAGGWRWVVVPAGYLGAAAFGAGLILLGTRRGAARWVVGALGAGLALLSLRFGLPSLWRGEWLGGALAVVTGVAAGAVLVTLASRAADRWVRFALHLLAFSIALAALSDLWTLIGLSAPAGGPATDARSMAEIAWLPPIFWALLWALGGVGLIAGAAFWAWGRSDPG